MSENILDNTRSVTTCITNAPGGHGIFGIEPFVHGGKVWFSGVSPRPHDTGMVTMGT